MSRAPKNPKTIRSLGFLTEAVRLCHPTEHSSLFLKEVRANIANLSSKTIHHVAKERAEEVKRWVALSTELSAEEKELKVSLSPRIAEVLKDKRLCLLETLLTEAGHEDLGLVDDIKKGFDLTGALPRSCDALRKVSNISRSVLLESVQSSGDRETDVSLFAATMKEVEKGFIQGPIYKDELRVGSTLTKRFPVKQKNKVRPIDDYKASLVNFAVTQNEGVTIPRSIHTCLLDEKRFFEPGGRFGC